ncbi:chromosome transmission fidelity protein 8 [Phyllosticta citricarpa]|uniref:Chromosome transmission fidelity protein 8 n=2 Tax=Phyllosticta TaxID=121621 RepID=A0ABR1MP26_9PEZI
MPSIPLHPKPTQPNRNENPLPSLLQTPSGLAILEIQGTINVQEGETAPRHGEQQPEHTPIGKLVFPLFDPHADSSDTAWMKRVHLYVGRHQRLTGEVKKLPKPLAVIRRRTTTDDGAAMDVDGPEELEVVEIVKFKVLFSHRPEPVSGD